MLNSGDCAQTDTWVFAPCSLPGLERRQQGDERIERHALAQSIRCFGPFNTGEKIQAKI
jgi:hypothetical protein